MRTAILSISTLLLGTAILLVGNGLQNVLLPVRAALENFSTSAIGLIASANSVGYVVSCYLTPYVVQRVGHIRTFAALAAVAAAVILSMGLLIHPLSWIALRMISGFCLAGLYMVIESWLNEKAENHNRGQIFSVYMMIQLSSITLGQLLLPSAELAGLTLFVIAGIAITLALVPVSLTTSSAPAPISQAQLRLRRLYQMSPVGFIGCFFVGMANSAYGGMGPVVAQQLGLPIFGVALFMSVALLGGALAQWPIGRLSDRIDRRLVIIGVCAGASAVGLLLASPIAGAFNASSLIAMAGLFGCFVYTMYSLCVAHTNDFISSRDFVEASGGLLLTYSLGAIVGPILAATVMEFLGSRGLFAFTATIHSAFLLFTLYRITRRAARPAQEREDFIGVNGPRMTPTAVELDPRSAPSHGTDEQNNHA